MMLTGVALLLAAAVACQAAPQSHRISDLPGLEKQPSFGMYSGYVSFGKNSSKNIFYWFVESQRSPKDDPVVLWMNGGPGASSLFGFFSEHGPFRPNSDGKTLSLFPYAWNRVANVLYIESPVFVGFSYSDAKADRRTGDAQVARDNFDFLVGWFDLFPEFSKNKFFISGESYAGHYVPMLASEILNRDTEKSINLQGVLIGNPLSNMDGMPFESNTGDSWGFFTFMFSHGLLSFDKYAAAVERCGWNNNYLTNCSTESFKYPSRNCLDALDDATSEIPRDVDWYGIDAPTCMMDRKLQRFLRTNRLANMESRFKKDVALPDDFDACLDSYVDKYINQESVQTAIHARPTDWHGTGFLIYSNEDQHDDMSPYYQRMFKANLRVLVYSGDFDSIQPFLGTQKFVKCLRRSVVKEWHTWHLDGQVSGSLVQYDKLSYLTIKGAGHMVPFYRPKEGFEFFEKWIAGSPLTSS